MDKKIYKEYIQKLNGHIKNSFMDMDLIYDENLKKQKQTFFNMLVLCDINLNDIKIIEGKTTLYDAPKKTITVNPDDSPEYVQYKVMHTILNRILYLWPIDNMEINKRVFLAIFINIGLIKVASKRVFNGSDKLIISNLAKLICASIDKK